MDVADYVEVGRCPHCGNARTTWTIQTIIAAIHSFADTHDVPPSIRDWRAAGANNPSSNTVRRMFGTWNRAIEAAGFKPRPRYGASNGRVWTRDRIANALLDEAVGTGRWPTKDSWIKASPTHPCSKTVYEVFGSWAAAKAYAGFTPPSSDPGVGRTVCSGCGGDLDGHTIGCSNCIDRRAKRNRRARSKRVPALATCSPSPWVERSESAGGATTHHTTAGGNTP